MGVYFGDVDVVLVLVEFLCIISLVVGGVGGGVVGDGLVGGEGFDFVGIGIDRLFEWVVEGECFGVCVVVCGYEDVVM